MTERIRFEKFILENQNEIDNDMTLLIVCNVRNKTKTTLNYETFSIDNEFLADDELDEITNMAIKQKIAYRIFYDEKDFITHIFSISKDELSKFIIYNSAQNGIGPGRKALIPSVCKYLSLRYTGSDPYRVCLCRDKFATYSILFANGIPVPFSTIYNGINMPNLPKEKTYIAKPLYESSSLGITNKNIFNGNDIPYTYLKELNKTMQQSILLQEFIDGYELEIPLLVGKKDIFSFPPVVLHRNRLDLKMGKTILDYECIHEKNYYFSVLPEKFDKKAVIDTAKNVALLLGLKGLCRVDFRFVNNEEFYVTDVATNPHFIKHSSVNFSFKQFGKKDEDIFKTILLLS